MRRLCAGPFFAGPFFLFFEIGFFSLHVILEGLRQAMRRLYISEFRISLRQAMRRVYISEYKRIPRVTGDTPLFQDDRINIRGQIYKACVKRHVKLYACAHGLQFR